MCRLQDLLASADNRTHLTGIDPAIEHEPEDLEGIEIPDETTRMPTQATGKIPADYSDRMLEYLYAM
jgi:hypothetical protein